MFDLLAMWVKPVNLYGTIFYNLGLENYNEI